MPIHKGYIRCKCCTEVAQVMEAEGKRLGELYVICPECGTDQSNRPTRQNYLRDNMVLTRAELEIKPTPEPVSEPVPDTESDTGYGWLKVAGVAGAVGLCLLGLKR